MTIDTTTFNEHASAPAGGQTVRLPGSDRAVALVVSRRAVAMPIASLPERPSNASFS
jgi:hypothetical protein